MLSDVFSEYNIKKLLSVTIACYYNLVNRLMSQKKYYKFWGVVLPPTVPGPPPALKRYFFARTAYFTCVSAILSGFSVIYSYYPCHFVFTMYVNFFTYSFILYKLNTNTFG